MTQTGEQLMPIVSNKKYVLKGRDIRRLNILVARAIAETLKTTLGPKGRNKILVTYYGDYKITNDGATILKEMEIVHPIAKMIVEVAKVQENEVGDGTKTAVVLAGELLGAAEELLDKKLHPTVIVRGYRLAAEKAIKILKKMATNAEGYDELKKIISTTIAGKISEESKGRLTDLILEAAKAVVETRAGRKFVDKNNVKIEKIVGGGIEDTELIRGFLIKKKRLNLSMPEKVSGAKIVLLMEPLKVKDTRSSQKEVPIDMMAEIKNREQLQAFMKNEEALQKEMVKKIKNSGANVLFAHKSVDDVAQHYLVKEGIFAVSGVNESDMGRLAKASGANVVTSLNYLSENDLGNAGTVEETTIDGEPMIFVKDCKDPKSVSFLIRGSTNQITDEVERAIEDCIAVFSTTIADKKVVPGGGACEFEVARQLRQYAKTIKGKEQLALEAFAQALEVIPKILAENAGIDPTDVLVELRIKHRKKGARYGIDVLDGKIKDMLREGVVEPLRVKTQAVSSATEVAMMILRVDDTVMTKS